MISQGGIHLLDIKNYLSDYYLKSDKLYSVTTDRQIKNPVDQLKRSSTLFSQLLHNLKLNYLAEAFVVFINPEFTLYQAPMDQPIIFPAQLNRFLNDLNKTPSKLNEGHKKLAQKIISLHQAKNPFTVRPKYCYEQLQKGFNCHLCHSFQIYKKDNEFVCGKCGGHEKIELAIEMHVNEFKLLFPDRRITTHSIYNGSMLI